MCGTCGCRDAESYEAPFFEMDDVCVSCGADEVAPQSNICEGCQIRFGIKKLGAESFEADVYVIESGSKTEKSFQELFDYLNSAIDDEYFLTKKERDDYFDKFYSYDAESFEAQRKLTDIDRDGKPYTGQIYPDHPNLDSVKADRNNDGYMSSWERALGNQVAMGMERGRYSAEGAGSRFPWKTLIAVAVGVFAVSRIKNVEFKAEGGCGCGCSGGGGCGDKKSAEGYPEVYDPVADFLPRYRYPADSVWSNDYNPADPYRPLDYQTVHTDSNTKAKRM
jgi:hypothetical protein